MNEPWGGPIPLDIHQLPPRWLVWVVTSCPIRLEQLSQHFHRWISFYLNHGCHPHMPHICDVHMKKEGATQFGEWLRWARKEAEEALKWTPRVSDESFNRSVCPTIYFAPGDLVYIEGTNIKTTQPSASPMPLWSLWGLMTSQWNFVQIEAAGHVASQTPGFPPEPTVEASNRSLATITVNATPSLDNDGEEIYDVEASVWRSG